MQVRVIGAHQLETPNTRHTCFLVDEVLAIDAGSLVTALTLHEQKKIKAILLTHRHLDHLRDVPGLGLLTLYEGGTIPIYSLAETLEILKSKLMDGVLYPDFTKDLTNLGPKYSLKPVSPGELIEVLEYEVHAVSVPHAAPTLGYIVRRPGGRSFAYCGDTGGGILPFFQDLFKPDPIFVEVSFADRGEELAKLTGHLTPNLLRQELAEAIEHKLNIPRVMIVHRNPEHDEEIEAEISDVSRELGIEVTLAHEDMVFDI